MLKGRTISILCGWIDWIVDVVTCMVSSRGCSLRVKRRFKYPLLIAVILYHAFVRNQTHVESRKLVRA